MGACISVYVNARLLKRVRIHKPLSLTSSNGDDNSGQKASHLIEVLKDPSGEDIHGRYEFGRELGRGEFGITYQCFDKATGEAVACKKISKSKLRTEIDVEDVRREVEIMMRLPKHPNIVSYKEVYEDKQSVFLVMELCEGGELFDRIVSKGQYTERAAALVTKTILEVLLICHKHGVIHRDLKPENFLYVNSSENAALKAIDFGLSVFFEPGQCFTDIVGSPYYMAPEVLRRNYGAEVDIWSAGVILYILLCGVPPFWAETEEGIAHAIVQGELDFNREPWPMVSEDAKDLIKGMLDRNPYTRLTVQEVLEHRWLKNANIIPNVPLGDVQTRIKHFALMNKFKKKVLRVVADNLSDEQVHGIKEIFNKMDKDKNGCLTFEELKDGLTMIGQPLPDHDVQMLIDAADVDGNGMLNCEEFVTLTVYITKMSNEDQLRDAFQYFDKNESGYIEVEELKEALFLDETLPPSSDQVILDIIFDTDLDKDGRISYQEFKAMMKTGMDWKMGSRQYSRVMLNVLSIKLFNGKSGQLK